MRVHRQSLCDALALLADVAEKRNTIPVLGHVRASAVDNSLTLVGTDLGVSLSVAIQCDGELPDCCPNLTTLRAAAMGMVGDDLKIVVADAMTLSAGKSRRVVKLLPVEDFPVVSRDTESDAVAIDGDVLRAALDFVKPAIGNDVARHYLNGVHVSDGVFAGTDSHRLHVYRSSLTTGSAILSTKFAGIVRRLSGSGLASLSIGKTRATFEAGAASVTGKLVEGDYPPYARVIPDGTGSLLTVAADEMLRAVQAVGAMGESRERPVKLVMDVDGVRVESSEAVEQVRDASWAGPDLQFMFGSPLLCDALRVYGERVIEMVFGAEKLSPLLLRCQSMPEGIAVVMPHRF